MEQREEQCGTTCGTVCQITQFCSHLVARYVPEGLFHKLFHIDTGLFHKLFHIVAGLFRRLFHIVAVLFHKLFHQSFHHCCNVVPHFVNAVAETVWHKAESESVPLSCSCQVYVAGLTGIKWSVGTSLALRHRWRGLIVLLHCLTLPTPTVWNNCCFTHPNDVVQLPFYPPKLCGTTADLPTQMMWNNNCFTHPK